jgi:hypothetical protein
MILACEHTDLKSKGQRETWTRKRFLVHKRTILAVKRVEIPGGILLS